MGAHGLGACLSGIDRSHQPVGAGKLWRGRGDVTRGVPSILGFVRDLSYIFSCLKRLEYISKKLKKGVQGIPTMRHILFIRSFASLACLAAVAAALSFGITAQVKAAEQSSSHQSITSAPDKDGFVN